jgi:hypothetical protein
MTASTKDLQRKVAGGFIVALSGTCLVVLLPVLRRLL